MSRIKQDSHIFLISSSFLFLVFPGLCDAQLLRIFKFDAMYQFGDSLADTGNRIILSSLPGAGADLCSKYPYGETFFNRPTGRCSNGLLIIDYLAKEAGLPFLNPYLKNDSDFSNGVNFAVAGATALPASVLAGRGVINSFTNNSLDIQLDWMSTFFNSTTGNAQKLKDALFVVGEIGGNEFNYAFSQGKTIEEAKSLVPEVVQVIKDAIRRVIQYGARRVVVPGNFPIGCLPSLLTMSKTNNATTYDEFNCSKELNNFAEYFNEHLQQAIKELRTESPETYIVYADYYNAFKWLFHNALFLGLDPESLLKACCGVDGDYNYDGVRRCGTPGVQACVDPNRLVSWDGVHLTEKAYMLISKYIIRSISPQLHYNA